MKLLKALCEQNGWTVSWFPDSKQFLILDKTSKKIVVNVSANINPPNAPEDAIDYWDVEQILPLVLAKLYIKI